MKAIVHSLALLALLSPSFSNGADISQTISLDRYTPIDSETFEHDTGFLFLDGTFHVTTSATESYSFYGLTPDDLAPVSGKPLMDETLYNSYHNMGLIPKWIDSPFDITIGFETFLVVGVKGKDDVGATVTITQEPQGVTQLAGGTVFFSVQAEPAQYLSYQWYFNRKPLAGEIESSLLVFDVKKAGVYKVAISGGGTPVMSDGALLQIVRPVTIKKQPASVTAKAGRKVTFSVVALGTGPLGYQWYVDVVGNGAIPNATNSTYTIPSVQESDAGQYYVTVTNEYTSALSKLVTLTVSP